MARSRVPRLIGGIIRFLFSLLVASVCGIIVWRVFFSANIPEKVSTIMANETLASACADGKELTFRYQDQPSVTRGEKDYGYFGVPSCVFIPEIDQVQIVFRYNNSTIRHLEKDYSLPSLPAKSEHLFEVSLVRTTDLTPENTADNGDPSTLQTTRYLPSASIREETALYTYYRYIFDGVTVEDVTVGILVDVYYVGDINYEQEAYGRLCIYSAEDKWLDYRLTGNDRKVLKNAKG